MNESDTSATPDTAPERPLLPVDELADAPADARSDAPTGRAAGIGGIALWTTAVLLTALVAAAFLFYSAGGRWFIVQTPSMGTTAPVGTLVLTTPADVDDIAVGDVVSFHPTTTPDETYTHRVTGRTDDGLLLTQGDINGAIDPWQTGRAELIGEVTTILPGVGWLVKGLPLLLAGGAIVIILTRFVRSATHRVSLRMLGLSFVVSATVFVLRPLVGIVVLEATREGDTTEATLVSTGMLPIRASAVGGGHVDLVSGEVGRISITSSSDDAYTLSSALHLSWWGWAIFIVLCALPLLYTLVVGLPAEGRPVRHAHRAEPGEQADTEAETETEAEADAEAAEEPEPQASGRASMIPSRRA